MHEQPLAGGEPAAIEDVRPHREERLRHRRRLHERQTLAAPAGTARRARRTAPRSRRRTRARRRHRRSATRVRSPTAAAVRRRRRRSRRCVRRLRDRECRRRPAAADSVPARCMRSGRLTPAAATAINTSPGAGAGAGRSAGCSTSGPPGRGISMAIMVPILRTAGRPATRIAACQGAAAGLPTGSHLARFLVLAAVRRKEEENAMRKSLVFIITAAIVAVVAVMLVRAARDDDNRYGPISATPLSTADLQFVATAAEGNDAEMDIAELARSTTKNSELKTLAERIEADHKQSNRELMEIADKKDADFPGADWSAGDDRRAEGRTRSAGSARGRRVRSRLDRSHGDGASEGDRSLHRRRRRAPPTRT